MTSQVLLLKPSDSNLTSSRRLHGRRLMLAWGVWFALALAAVVLFIIAMPAYFDTVRTPTPNAQLDFFTPVRLFPEDAAALKQIGLSAEHYAGYLSLIWGIQALFLWGVGIFLFQRKPNERITLFISLTLMLFGGITVQNPTSALVATNLAWYVPYNFLLGLTTSCILFMFYLFPDGRPVPRWTLWIGIVWLVWTQVQTVAPESPLNQLRWPLLLVMPLAISIFGSGFYAQIFRFRHVSTLAQRQQSKWAVVGFAWLVPLRLMLPALLTVLFPATSQPGGAHVVFNLITQTGAVLSGLVLAVTLGLALLRYRLWDIDLVLHRSLVYGTLTAVLGLAFLVSALVLQQILQFLSGGMQSPLALGLSTVVVGGLFQPARRRLQSLVDRRFFHLRAELKQFAARPSPISHPGALSGRVLGLYQVQEPIGRGGMGEVYRGFQPSLGRIVAIKTLPTELADDVEFRTRFEREARTVATLRHANIVHVFDFGQADTIYYMVMEYIDGQELSQALKQRRRFALGEAIPILKDIASALDYAHQQGLVHRDVKPSNIILQPVTDAGRSGGLPHPYRAVLMDFGIAKIRDAHTAITGTGLIGTLDYAAPEQILAAKTVDAQADIYALGVLAYQMLTGELPFKRDNVGALVFAHLNQPSPDARLLVPDLPEAAAQAIRKAMAKKSEERFATAGEFVAALG